MKIVILTGKFGMGHIKAAEAIKEELTLCQELPEQMRSARELDIEIIDLDLISDTPLRQIYLRQLFRINPAQRCLL